jgi:hypothetical protein
MAVRSFKIVRRGSIPFDAFEPVDSRAMAVKNLAGIGCGSTVTYIESDARILIDTGFEFDSEMTDDNVKLNRKLLVRDLKAIGQAVRHRYSFHHSASILQKLQAVQGQHHMTSEAAVDKVSRSQA